MLVLSAADMEDVLTLEACVGAVAQALAAAHDGRAYTGSRSHVPVDGGAFHVVAGGLRDPLPVIAVKSNGRVAGGVRGAILLQDAASGAPLALLHSRRLTALRTAALAAIMARRLAPAGARRAVVLGAGGLSAPLVEALRPLEVTVWARGEGSAADAVAGADVIVTATSAREPLFGGHAVADGALVIALGADAPDKQEHDPALLGRARVVVDALEQCRRAGELRAALAAGAMRVEDVVGDVAAVAAGALDPRRDAGDIVVVDSTGTAIQDAAAALAAFTAAREQGRGTTVPFA